ncbi:Carbohydrate sulfotransferase 11 [Mactra antiquata]
MFINFGEVKYASKKAEMEARRDHMRHVCSQYPKRRQLNRFMKGSLFYISEKYNLSYCRVAKVGSTFWTQAFLTFSGIRSQEAEVAHAQNSSLFDLPRDESHLIIKKHNELTMGLSDKRVHSTVSFLVSRNPYSRLFSSYIDQIYLPNKWFLASYMIPGKAKKNQLVCGNDITFDTFLNFASDFIIKGVSIDLHWAPIFSICKPCITNIDILAKQESFNEDAEYILDLVGVDQASRKEIENILKETNKESAIAGLVHTYVTKAHDRTNVKKGCISEKALAERLWHAFQIQGHIHNDVPFPVREFSSSSEKETEKKLTKLVLNAVKEYPLTSEERNAQREKWKRYFWKQISLSTLQHVQDAFFEDFVVFGYDLDPNTI